MATSTTVWSMRKAATSDNVSIAADINANLDIIDARLATGYPRSGMSNITPIRILGVLNHTGPPVAADGTFAVGDVVWDSTGLQYVCTVAGSPGTWVCPARAGTAIARASNTAQETVADASEVDYTSMSVTFDSPADRDLWVVAKVPYVGSVNANATQTVKLTDGSNTLKDYATGRPSTASRNHVTLMLDEVITAGSGTGLVRKLRTLGAGGAGFANGLGLGRATLDVFVR